MADADAKRIAHLQMEAIHFSFTDKIGTVVQKAIESAQSVLRNDSIDELEFAKTSLQTQMEIVQRWDKNRDDSTRKQIYALCEILEFMIKDKIESSSLRPLSHESRLNDVAINQTMVTQIGSNESIEYSDQYKDFAIVNDVKENMDAHSKLEDEDTYFDEIENPETTVKNEIETHLISDESMNQPDAIEPELQELGNAHMKTTEENSQLSTHDAESFGDMLEDYELEDVADDDNFIEEDSDDWYDPDDENNRSKGRKRKRIDNNSEDAHKCDQCDSAYRHHYNLIRHKRDKHAVECGRIRGPVACETCRKEFRSSYDCKKHSLTHLPKEDTPKAFACETCGNRFTTRSSLKRHSKAHSKELLEVTPVTNNYSGPITNDLGNDNRAALDANLLKYMRVKKEPSLGTVTE